MIITGRDVLDTFCAKHTDARSWIESWLDDAEESKWLTPQDIKHRYASVSFVSGLVIFNVKGNEYRMETVVAFKTGVVRVKWAGTHREYDARNRKR